MRKSKGNVFVVLLVIIILFGAVGVCFAVFKDNSADNGKIEQVIEVTEQDGKLSAAQIKSLNGGAIIKYNDEIYQLSQIGEENVYTHIDDENIFVRKYISVNTSDGFYRSWTKVNDEYVTKALLDTALSGYATDSDINSALSTVLANYTTSAEMQNLLTNALASYVKNSDGKGLVNMYYLYNQLTFKTNTLYAVQGFDNTQNLADFTIVGGGKDGKTGRFALVFIGDKINESLVVYQTGSIVISDLAGTSGGSTGIKPASNGYLRVFEIGGKVF